MGLETLIAEHLSDSRQGLNTQFTLADLLRQSVYSRLAGYEDLNDAVRVSADPTFRLIGSPTLWDRGAALTSTLHWFETDLLTQDKNLVGLMAVNRELLAQAGMPTRAGRIVLDMDSSESPVHGAQEGSAYNGHFESVCYHPLFLFTEHGGCVAATLRPGNVHSADDWADLLVPEIDRQQAEGTRVAFRADAAFAKPEIYEALEQRDVDYAIRMPANKSLELDIEDILFRPPGRPSCKPLVRYKSFRYQAKSWTTPRRIVAKVEHHRGELFPRVGFIVTNMALPSRSVVRFYNKRDERAGLMIMPLRGAGLMAAGAGAGSEVSRGHLLKNRVVEGLVRHQLLEPRVLPLELLEPFRLVETQPPVLLPPAVVRLLTDPQLLADLGRAQTAAQLHLGLA